VQDTEHNHREAHQALLTDHSVKNHIYAFLEGKGVEKSVALWQ
jgi:hypothetical protein